MGERVKHTAAEHYVVINEEVVDRVGDALVNTEVASHAGLRRSENEASKRNAEPLPSARVHHQREERLSVCIANNHINQRLIASTTQQNQSRTAYTT